MAWGVIWNNGAPLDWMKFYIANRMQATVVNGFKSSTVKLFCGVPQGWVLRLLLFVLYTKDVITIIKRHGLLNHCYVDDIQIYFYWKNRKKLTHLTQGLQPALMNCVWMKFNRLKLNVDKIVHLDNQLAAMVNVYATKRCYYMRLSSASLTTSTPYLQLLICRHAVLWHSTAAVGSKCWYAPIWWHVEIRQCLTCSTWCPALAASQRMRKFEDRTTHVQDSQWTGSIVFTEYACFCVDESGVTTKQVCRLRRLGDTLC